MSDRHIFRDIDGDEIELTQFTSDGIESDEYMWLVVPGHESTETAGALFSFSRVDARRFARALMAFAEDGE